MIFLEVTDSLSGNWDPSTHISSHSLCNYNFMRSAPSSGKHWHFGLPKFLFYLSKNGSPWKSELFRTESHCTSVFRMALLSLWCFISPFLLSQGVKNMDSQIRISVPFCIETEKWFLDSHGNIKSPEYPKQNSTGDITIINFKLYYRAMII